MYRAKYGLLNITHKIEIFTDFKAVKRLFLFSPQRKCLSVTFQIFAENICLRVFMWEIERDFLYSYMNLAADGIDR